MRILALAFFGFLLFGCDSRDDTELTAPVIDSSTTPDEFLQYINTFTDPTTGQSMIDNDAYAEAYYSAVDPNNLDTLTKWKMHNNFDNAAVTNATFRDAKDLGYGRDMYAWQHEGNTYIYVNNYVVELQPGDATQYGPLNLDAAIEKNPQYHIGTNAIEFSPDPTDPADPKHRIVKFFIFGPADANGVQRRLNSADLDGRGVKYMPTMCTVCHGGTMYPLTNSGEFNPISLKSTHLHILEKGTLEFSQLSPFTSDDQEDPIKIINGLVLETFEETGKRQDSNSSDDRANWDSSFAEALLKSAYNVESADELKANSVSYQAGQVPDEWESKGKAQLYTEVIEPHCIGCHSLRGTMVAGPENAISFSSYDNFMKYSDQIVKYVYQYAVMPLSLINYTQFWEDPNGGPRLLADDLIAFQEEINAEKAEKYKDTIFDSSGQIQRPGRPIAVPGDDRTVTLDTAVQNATASKFTTEYSWRVLNDSSAMLDDYASPAPRIVDTAGDSVIELELTTSNSQSTADPESVKLTVNSDLTPTVPIFVDSDPNQQNILTILKDNGCSGCHRAEGGYDGIPIYYLVDDYKNSPLDFYRNVLDRVNQGDPEDSLLLRKASGKVPHVGAGTPLTKENYNTVLNWVRGGVVCGVKGSSSTMSYCPADAACIDNSNPNMITACN